MTGSVCLLVVTFNRKALLLECLAGIRAQLRKPDHVLVVDNASTDGTQEAVTAQFPEFQYLRMEKNTGGAGGFSHGIQTAYDLGYEWIWVMDDDVEPYPEALETLCSYTHLGQFLHLRRSNPDGEFPWQGVLDLSGPGIVPFRRDIAFSNGVEWIPVNYGCFEGAFFHRRIVESIGVPDPRFFASGDDMIYGLMASFHTPVLYINKPGLKRKLTPNRGTIHFRHFLWARNRYLAREHALRAGLPIVPFLFWARTLYNTVLVAKDALSGTGTWASVKMNLKGNWAGLHRRFGVPPWIKT